MPTDPQIDLITRSAIFDARYYASQFSKYISDDPSTLIAHFISTGARQGLSPHPLFQTRFYLDKYPDVASAGINPLIHFISHGSVEGRLPNPFFDSNYYSESFPVNGETRSNSLSHYLSCKSFSKPATHPLFDTQFYLTSYPEVLLLEEDPLDHYLRIGHTQQRRAYIEFDPAFYLKTYLDVAHAGLDPLEHFRLYGRTEGRLPRARSLPTRNEALLKNILTSLGDTTKKLSMLSLNKSGLEHVEEHKNGEQNSSMQVLWGSPVYESSRMEQLLRIAHRLPAVKFYVHNSFLIDESRLAQNIKAFNNALFPGIVAECSFFVNPIESAPLSELLLLAIQQRLLVISSDDCELSAYLTPQEANFLPDGITDEKIIHALSYAAANRTNMISRATAAAQEIFAVK